MKLVIFTPKSTYSGYIKSGIKEYAKRLSRYCQISHTDYSTIEELQTLVADKYFVLTISPVFNTITSEQLASSIDKIGIDGYSSIALCLLDSAHSFKSYDSTHSKDSIQLYNSTNSIRSHSTTGESADSISTYFALSKMALSQESALLLLYEQLYRSYRIIYGEPYHK